MVAKVVDCSTWVHGLVLVLALIVTASPVNGITCMDTLAKLLFCEGFLQGWGGVSYFCCQGAATLNEIAYSKPDRQIMCKCLKLAAPLLGVRLDRAQQIPRLCQINLTVPIDPSIDCDSFDPQNLNIDGGRRLRKVCNKKIG